MALAAACLENESTAVGVPGTTDTTSWSQRNNLAGMGSNRLALKWGRRLFPRLVWSGAGVVARKSYFERGAGGGWMPMVPAYLQQGWVSGTVPPRWVLVVADNGGKEHAVAVAAEVWEAYEVGDVVNADNPLVDID